MWHRWIHCARCCTLGIHHTSHQRLILFSSLNSIVHDITGDVHDGVVTEVQVWHVCLQSCCNYMISAWHSCSSDLCYEHCAFCHCCPYNALILVSAGIMTYHVSYLTCTAILWKKPSSLSKTPNSNTSQKDHMCLSVAWYLLALNFFTHWTIL